jgi:hypothetical protein
VEHSFPQEALVRPWRRAAAIATLIAAVELVLLVVAGIVLLARPLSRHIEAQAAAPPKAKAPHRTAALKPPSIPKPQPVGTATLPRARTGVLVLNGNGRTGAAGLEATLVRSRGYPVTSIGNAHGPTFPHSLVMYRPGLRAEGARLARDLGIKLFVPLDGLTSSDLRAAKLAVVVGVD